jgi:hypothetical protein
LEEIRSQCHAFFEHGRSVAVQARRVASDSMDAAAVSATPSLQWHPISQLEMGILEEAGISLTKLGIQAGTEGIEIKWNVHSETWNEAVKVHLAKIADPELRAKRLQSLRVTTIDNGQRTILHVALLYPNCQIRVGHGTAAYVDRHFDAKRRAMDKQRNALLRSDADPVGMQCVCVCVCMLCVCVCVCCCISRLPC